MRRAAFAAAVALAVYLQAATAGHPDDAAPRPTGLIALSYRGVDPFLVAVITPTGKLRGEYAWRGGLDSCCPAWSGDARQIAFLAVVPLDDRERYDIWLMNADGSNQRLLKRNADFVAWSPTGERLAFVRSDSIYVMRLDGSAERRIARDAASPTWSPDGRRIAFIRRNDVYAMRADGSEQHRLTRTRALEASPDWSPTGTLIAYARRSSRDASSHVFAMKADGSGQHRVSRMEGADDPSWSPDATRIVFDRRGSSVIFTINADGSGQRRIFGPCTSCSGPDWSPR